MQYFAVSVEAAARGADELSGQCLTLQVAELTLNPLGFVGTVTNFLGVTEPITQIVLEEARTLLAENPICPKLPPEVATLQPDLQSGGTREIGEGGLGAAVSGSVDVSPAAMVTLLAAFKENGLLEGFAE